MNTPNEKIAPSMLSAAGLFHLILELYGAIPARFSLAGHALPTWYYCFELTRRCNLRCKMCQYLDWLSNTPPETQAKDELTTEEWLRVVGQTGALSMLTFTGGEPWSRPDFSDILSYACARRRVHFISNCVLFNEERARLCAELAPKRMGGKGLNFIGVSIDGPYEMHDFIRSQEGAFDKAAKGIAELNARKRALGKTCPMVHLTTVIQKDNVSVLPAMPRVAKEFGADVLNLTLEIDFQGFGESGRSTLPHIQAEELQAALEATIANAHAVGINLRLPRMPLSQIIRYYNGGVELSHFACQALWTTIAVTRTGDVFSCLRTSVGNVRHASLKSLRNNPKFRALRLACKKQLPDACQGCCELVWTP